MGIRGLASLCRSITCRRVGLYILSRTLCNTHWIQPTASYVYAVILWFFLHTHWNHAVLEGLSLMPTSLMCETPLFQVAIMWSIPHATCKWHERSWNNCIHMEPLLIVLYRQCTPTKSTHLAMNSWYCTIDAFDKVCFITQTTLSGPRNK